MDKTEARGTVASATPGRVRVRLHRASRHPRVVRRVQQHVEQGEGVTRVEANPSTGSVVVHYDRHATTLDDVLGVFRDCGVVVGAVTESVDVGDILTGRTPASQQILDAVDDLDRRLFQITGQKMDLRLLFPATLFALGLRQALVEGFGLSQVPAYVLLWYAFDSFWKLQRELPPRRAEDDSRQAATAEPKPFTPLRDDVVSKSEVGGV
jgi:hypothetical protein